MNQHFGSPMTDEAGTCYDLVFSPDDGGWWVDFPFEDADSPVFQQQQDADDWAKAHGGKKLLRVVD
jgi:hypothetical protein